MMIVPDKIATWQIVEPPVLNKETGRIDPGQLELAEIPVPEFKAGQVLVEVAGCAICRMVADSTGAQSSIPLTYEISGTVVAGDDAWMGKEVLIPAMLSCGQYDFCMKGHGPCCANPRTPLNHWQIPSCFSSHIPVSGSNLFEIRHRKQSLPLEHLAGVVDALMAPFQALQWASLGSGDPVIVIGLHEMGPYLVQMAKASGAGMVIALEWNQLHSQASPGHGTGPEFVINCANKNAETITAEVKMHLVNMVTSGEVQVSPFVLTRPMSWIHETFREINSLDPDKRIILTPDDFGLDFSPEPKSCR